MELGQNIEAIFAALITCGVLGITSLILFAIGLYLSQKGAAARRWPTAPGVVTAARVQESHSSEGGTTYRPAITYQYTVMGQTYQNDLLAFGAKNQSGGRGGAQKKVVQYPIGQQVMVHYDPQQPTQSVLEARGEGVNLYFGLAALFLLIGLCVIVIVPFVAR